MSSPVQVPPGLVIESITLGNATALVSFVGLIIEKTKTVLAFRDECSELANRCIVLSLGLLERSNSLKAYRAAKDFQKCLREVFLLVSECSATWTIRHVGWTLWVEKKLKSLKGKLDAWQKAFDSEVLMGVDSKVDSAVRDLQSMQHEMNALKHSISNDLPERKKYLEQVGLVTYELSVQTRSAGSKASSLWLDARDTRLRILQRAGAEPVSGSFDGTAIIFVRIGTLYKDLDHVTKIYKMIGDIALVQRLFGLVEINGAHYAVMQDLNGFNNLAEMTATEDLRGFPIMTKLRFLYELAATLSALHSSHLLVKALSDRTVFIDASHGEPRPLLSNLPAARDIWEVTNRQEQDARYEAPETSTLAMHSRTSDIWSFAVLAFQWLSSEFPYGLTASDLTDETVKQIRQRLQSGSLPFNDSITEAKTRVSQILLHCLATDPRLRPTADELAQQFHEILVEEGARALLGSRVEKDESLGSGPSELSVEGVLEAVSGRKPSQAIPDAVAESEIPPTAHFTAKALGKLIDESRETSASAHFAVGCAYLHGLVHEDTKNVSSTITSEKVIWAKKAVPYFDRAHEMGYTGANKELFNAYKTLAAYYREKATVKDK